MTSSGPEGPRHRQPEDPSSPPDAERIYAKVRALLRKAESTAYAPEAEALTAKAQDLLTRHALDVALVADAAGSDVPEVRSVAIHASYATGRTMLLGAVASANRCTAIWDSAASTAMVVGHRVDLDATDLLWASLVTQAEVAIAVAGPKVDARGRSRTRSWRTAFWAAFAQRIGQRLADQARVTTDEVAATSGALVPVLAARQREVDAVVRDRFPRITTRRTRVSNGDGWDAGREAADRADLGARRPVGGVAGSLDTGRGQRRRR